MMSEPEKTVTFELRVDDEVYRSVAERCLDRIPAVMSGRRLGQLPRGTRTGAQGPEIRVHTADGGPVQVDLTVDLDDSVPIPSVAASLQREVKSVVEDMTGTEVSRVDVTVRRLWPMDDVTSSPHSPAGKGKGDLGNDN